MLLDSVVTDITMARAHMRPPKKTASSGAMMLNILSTHQDQRHPITIYTDTYTCTCIHIVTKEPININD